MTKKIEILLSAWQVISTGYNHVLRTVCKKHRATNTYTKTDLKNYTAVPIIKVKVQFNLKQATKAHRVSTDIDLLFL
jgi:hypothetical protein